LKSTNFPETISEMRDEGNAIAAMIEADFGAVYRRREAFKDHADARLWLGRMRAAQCAMRKGRRERELAANKKRPEWDSRVA
jgi:hypothetical protein